MNGNSNLSLSANTFCFWTDFLIILAPFSLPPPSPQSTTIYLGDNKQAAIY